MLRRSILVGIFLAALLFSLSGASAAAISTEIRTEPSPVIAGRSAYVILSVQAVGGEATDVEVRMAKSDIPVEDGTFTLGDVAANEVRESVFKLNVPRDQEEGTYRAKIVIDYDDREIHRFAIIEVENPKEKPILELVDTSTDGDPISPGDSFRVSITIRNIGSENARDVRVSWEQANFTPEGPNLKHLEEIGRGENEQISFGMIVNREVEPKAYPVLFKISYEDEDGIEQEPTSLTVGVGVGGISEFSLSSNLREVKAGSTEELEIRTANVGPVDAHSLMLGVVEEGPFRIAGRTEVYIGTLRSGDFDFARFTLSVDKGASGSSTLPIDVTYKDAYARSHSYTENISIYVRAAEEVSPARGFFNRLLSMIRAHVFLTGLIIVVVALLSYVAYRRRKG